MGTFLSKSKPTLPEGWADIGQVQYDLNDIRGEGAHATVFGGVYGIRPVAVKRVQTHHFKRVFNEEKHLVHLDSNDNVVRYWLMENDTMFYYLVLELCDASLRQYVEDKSKYDFEISPQEILKQSTKGLAYLHSKNIAHCDVKPHNVLFTTNGESVKVVLSDFGLCKDLGPDNFSLSTSSGISGSEGWIAPEVLKGETKSFPRDIFPLGCLFYYVLSNGSHPFGEYFERNKNILEGRYSLKGLKCSESVRLIKLCLSSCPDSRPTASEILYDPYFWTAEMKIEFFCDASDKLAGEGAKSPMSLRIKLEGDRVATKDWTDLLCDPLKQRLLQSNANQPRIMPVKKYKGSSVADLVRLIRNMKHHLGQEPTDVQESLGEMPDEFAAYFTSRFPNLLLHVYKTAEWWSDTSPFKKYYSNEVRTRVTNEKGVQGEIPSVDVNLYNPSEWKVEKQLVFLLRLSDRLFAEVHTTTLSQRLQRSKAISGDWNNALCEPLKKYLSSTRSNGYNGRSVRELLKVIKTLKDRYPKLDKDLVSSLGEMPKGFVAYFTSRFPRLLNSVYEAAECCSEEPNFIRYYSDLARLQYAVIRAQSEERNED